MSKTKVDVINELPWRYALLDNSTIAFVFEESNSTQAILLCYEDKNSIIPIDAIDASALHTLDIREILSEGIYHRRFFGGGTSSHEFIWPSQYGEEVNGWTTPIYLPKKENNIFWDLVEMLSEGKVGTTPKAAKALEKFKCRGYLEEFQRDLFSLTRNVTVVPPEAGMTGLDFLVLSASYGCTGRCRDCEFREGGYESVDDGTFQQQLEVYERYLGKEILKHIGIVFGNMQAGREGLDRLNHLADMVDSRWRRNGMVPYRLFATFPDILDIKSLAKPNRFVLNVGLESGNPYVRQQYGKKNFTNDDVKKAYKLMQELKIPWSLNILSGIESENHITQTVELLRECVQLCGKDNLPHIYMSEYVDSRSIASKMGVSLGPVLKPNAITLKAARGFADQIRTIAKFEVRPYGFFAYSRVPS